MSNGYYIIIVDGFGFIESMDDEDHTYTWSKTNGLRIKPKDIQNALDACKKQGIVSKFIDVEVSYYTKKKLYIPL